VPQIVAPHTNQKAETIMNSNLLETRNLAMNIEVRSADLPYGCIAKYEAGVFTLSQLNPDVAEQLLTLWIADQGQFFRDTDAQHVDIALSPGCAWFGLPTAEAAFECVYVSLDELRNL
jgi:hypothetical protein